jgi:hypothetical protein
VITASTAGNSPQIADKNIQTVFQYLTSLVLQKLQKSSHNFKKNAKVVDNKRTLDKMAAWASHMTLKRTNGNSYFHPGKLRQCTTIVKDKYSDRYKQVHHNDILTD